MVLKKHHKILIGSFSSLIIIFMIASSVFMYYLLIRQTIAYDYLNNKMTALQKDIGTLTESLIETENKLDETTQSLNLKIGSVQENVQKELSEIKLSVSADFSGIIEDATKSVVTVKTNSGLGTGFVISNENNSGYIVTNAHVLADPFGKLASGIRVITYDKDIINADFVGYDGDFDIALLKIPRELSILELANSDDVQIGERVIAIGNPLGLEFSASEGIVSAVHREGQNGVNAYIQTDAALNPGNSGGPLINKNGKVIGINNFKISGSENIGFALESNYIKKSINAISQKELGMDLI